MATDFAMDNYIALELKNSEDENTINSITNVIKSNFKDFKLPEEDVSDDYGRLLNQATLALKNFSNAYYKNTKFVDLEDVEQIKRALKNYKDNNQRVSNFKKELIDDLTKFQQQIKTTHVERIDEFKKQYRDYKRQIIGLEAEKNRLIMERLSKIVWPYDAKTKEYDEKIAKFEALANQYERKLEEAQKLRPLANEKDILLYQMHLKETFKTI